MKVLVCGGRFYGEVPHVRVTIAAQRRAERERGHVQLVLSAFHAAQPIVRLIEGGARGADRWAREWREARGIDGESYPADWNTYGKAAGPIRNGWMLNAEQPDVVIAFPGGAGTADMVKQAREAGVEVFVVQPLPDKANGAVRATEDATP